MPEQPENYEPSAADIDMIVEATTGKPVKPADIGAGIASMRQRIAQLEAEKARLLDHLDAVTDAAANSLTRQLDEIKRNLHTARQRLGHYQAQVGKEN